MAYAQVNSKPWDLEDVSNEDVTGEFLPPAGRPRRLPVKVAAVLGAVGLLGVGIGGAAGFATAIWSRGTSETPALGAAGPKAKIMQLAEEPRFNCDAERSNWRQAWTPVKQDWCCTNANFGCEDGPAGAMSGGMKYGLLTALAILVVGVFVWVGIVFYQKERKKQLLLEQHKASKPNKREEREVRTCTNGCVVQ
mmetsp:Transcript_110918/g.347069  ORF Transcript_110918/g.347069 Transcript_110918/m.347069 type:complete len:194 (-) Transcript_110918:79-660(-)